MYSRTESGTKYRMERPSLTRSRTLVADTSIEGTGRPRPARPPLLPRRSGVRHARGQTSPRTAPAPPARRRSRRSVIRGRRRCGRFRAGVGDGGTAPVDALGVGIEAPQVLARLV